jgi:hypothetical protein
MGKKPNTLDNLTLDVLAAEAGGMSYGKYKGLQHERGQSPRPAPVIEQKAEPEHKEFNLVCVHCGKHYIGRHPRRKYCSEACKSKHDSAAYRERHPKDQKEVNNGGT